MGATNAGAAVEVGQGEIYALTCTKFWHLFTLCHFSMSTSQHLSISSFVILVSAPHPLSISTSFQHVILVPHFSMLKELRIHTQPPTHQLVNVRAVLQSKSTGIKPDVAVHRHP